MISQHRENIEDPIISGVRYCLLPLNKKKTILNVAAITSPLSFSESITDFSKLRHGAIYAAA